MTAVTSLEDTKTFARMRLATVWAALLAAFLLIFGSTLVGASSAQAAAVTDTQNGMTFSADDANVSAGASITAYNAGVGGVTPVIPATVTIGTNTYSVTGIGDSAFKNKGLTSVTIPNTVTTIGPFAFGDNSLLTVTIPNSVTTLGNYSFGSNNLTSVSISNAVTSIGSNVFSYNHLGSVVIPDLVTDIGTNAFFGNNLTSVTIPNSVNTIGYDAFAQNLLTSVTIPSSVNDIKDKAFSDNPSLTDVVFLGPAPVTFTAAGVANGSLGFTPGPVVHYPNSFAAPPAGGYTTPTWQGYTSQRNPIVTLNMSGHGAAIAPEDVGFGLPATAPTAPTASGWKFTGWFTDSVHTNPASFSSPIAKDTTLYAGWAADPVLAATGNTVPVVPVTIFGAAALIGGILLRRRARPAAR
ncbi:MAG TPA: leucine-rich repeat protein [Terrimesophilobacter sp.]|nr:leucine-rich repeat protein [Terrimesophilobacter sp.]